FQPDRIDATGSYAIRDKTLRGAEPHRSQSPRRARTALTPLAEPATKRGDSSRVACELEMVATALAATLARRASFTGGRPLTDIRSRDREPRRSRLPRPGGRPRLP